MVRRAGISQCLRKSQARCVAIGDSDLDARRREAALTLTKIFLGKPTDNQSARVSAARATLRLALDANLLEDVHERLLKIEGQKDEF
jgi:hypothetical protein